MVPELEDRQKKAGRSFIPASGLASAGSTTPHHAPGLALRCLGSAYSRPRQHLYEC